MTDKIRKAVDSSKCCGVVMLNFEKVFDTVETTQLYCKLKAIGFDEKSLRWVQSYLYDRSQIV